jgi:hypothetical protein
MTVQAIETFRNTGIEILFLDDILGRRRDDTPGCAGGHRSPGSPA